jgi:hypothetical protein
MKTSRLELFFEQHEVWRVRHANDLESMPCPRCAEDSPMIAAEKLAEALGESPRNIYKRIDEGSVHFVETEKMHVLVCLTSFSKRSQE